MMAYDHPTAGCIIASVVLALASCERSAHAEELVDQPTFHLDYQLLDEESRKTCPREATVKNLFSRIFSYPVIDPDAGPGFAIDVAYSSERKGFEVVGHVLRDDKYVLGTEMDRSGNVGPDACFRVLYGLIIGLASEKDELKSRLKSPQGSTSAREEASGGGFVFRSEIAKRFLEAKRPSGPLSAPPPKPAVAPTPWRLPEGFALSLGTTASVALLPTPSAGGMMGISYRKGAWSGGIEARFDRGLVPAYLRNTPVDVLYAGAVLAAPFVHQGSFSAGLVIESGGYSCSTDQSFSSIEGRLFMMSVGLRANLDLRVAEHFVIRGFVQASALTISPEITLSGTNAWNSGPGYGTVGLSLVMLP